MKNFKRIFISLCVGLGLIFGLSGCISAKADAFLVGAALGAGTTYYLMKGGTIGGVGLNSMMGQTRKPTLMDMSVPSDMEWILLEQDTLQETARLQTFVQAQPQAAVVQP